MNPNQPTSPSPGPGWVWDGYAWVPAGLGQSPEDPYGLNGMNGPGIPGTMYGFGGNPAG